MVKLLEVSPSALPGHCPRELGAWPRTHLAGSQWAGQAFQKPACRRRCVVSRQAIVN